jgi:hypothetical protein
LKPDANPGFEGHWIDHGAIYGRGSSGIFSFTKSSSSTDETMTQKDIEHSVSAQLTLSIGDSDEENWGISASGGYSKTWLESHAITTAASTENGKTSEYSCDGKDPN